MKTKYLDKTLIFIFGCKKVEENGETGILTDFDGTSYNIVKIGNQW